MEPPTIAYTNACRRLLRVLPIAQITVPIVCVQNTDRYALKICHRLQIALALAKLCFRTNVVDSNAACVNFCK